MAVHFVGHSHLLCVPWVISLSRAAIRSIVGGSGGILTRHTTSGSIPLIKPMETWLEVVDRRGIPACSSKVTTSSCRVEKCWSSRTNSILAVSKRLRAASPRAGSGSRTCREIGGRGRFSTAVVP